MRGFLNIPRGRAFWGWPPTLFILIVLVGALATSTVRIVLREESFRRERQMVQVKIQELQAEEERLKERLRALGHPDVIERLAKEKLNLKKSGEEVVVVVPESRSATGTDANGKAHRAPFGWLGELINFLSR